MAQTSTDGEMPLSAALRRAQEELSKDFPIWAVRKAVVDGVIPSRRSSLTRRARYYVQWDVLVTYWNNLKQ